MAVQEITKDITILQTKSTKASKADTYIIQDLLDTAEYNRERCCGLAAIQISQPKRIIVVLKDDEFIPLINPRIVKMSPEKYKATEGCMSLDGEREVIRHNTITIMYENKYGKINKAIFGGRVAEIIQHEVDHCNGKLI